jgi:6-phosphogluconolactonase
MSTENLTMRVRCATIYYTIYYKKGVLSVKHIIYIGTWSKGENGGLFSAEFDDSAGGLRLLSNFEIDMPSYLQYAGGILYGVSETDSYNGDNGGSVFSILTGESGGMELLSQKPTNGKHPCHLCAADNWVYVSNYSEGTLTVLRRDENGAISEPLAHLAHYGKGPNPKRQEKSHIHFAALPPEPKRDGDSCLGVCDLGTDRVHIYSHNETFGLKTYNMVINCPPGSGPRHLAFSSDDRYLYILTEMGNTVLVYQADGGEIHFKQEVSTLPPEFSGNSTAAAIRISPDGRTLAASNRGHDSVALFAVNRDGTLQNPPEFLKTGKTPRDFVYSANGEWILCANQSDNFVAAYKTDGSGEQVSQIEIPKPTCIVFGGTV